MDFRQQLKDSGTRTITLNMWRDQASYKKTTMMENLVHIHITKNKNTLKLIIISGKMKISQLIRLNNNNCQMKNHLKCSHSMINNNSRQLDKKRDTVNDLKEEINKTRLTQVVTIRLVLNN